MYCGGENRVKNQRVEREVFYKGINRRPGRKLSRSPKPHTLGRGGITAATELMREAARKPIKLMLVIKLLVAKRVQ